MKNVTISIDDETHQRARIRAAELGTSLSALVRHYLQSLGALPADDSAPFSGVRDMAMAYHPGPGRAAFSPLAAAGQAALADASSAENSWISSNNAKPRRPGAMRAAAPPGAAFGEWTAAFDTWPDGFLDALHDDDGAAADSWWGAAHPASIPPAIPPAP